MNEHGLAMTLMPPTIAVSIAAGAQRLDGLMQGDERGRAGGVDRDARPVQVEDVGDAVGQDRQRIAGHEVRVRDRRVAGDAVAVVGQRGADEHADLIAGDRRRTDAGVFQRFPGQFQQDALLRVHLLRFARRNAEHAGIETPEIVEDAGRPRIAPAALLAAGVTEALQREPVGGDLRDRALAFQQEGPKLGDRIRTGKAARPADDSNFIMELMNCVHTSPPHTTTRHAPRRAPESPASPYHTHEAGDRDKARFLRSYRYSRKQQAVNKRT